MKKFIVSVLSVSIFFISLGGIVEQTSAKLKSDARASELVRLARIAIGGDANIRNVRSMTIMGTTSHNFNINGVMETKQGNLEINFELPSKFSKMVRVGEPGDGSEDVRKEVDVVIVRKGGENLDLKGAGEGKKVVIVKDGDGKVLTENIQPIEGDRRIIIKKKDGTEISDDIKGDGDSAAWTTADGKKFTINKDVKVSGEGEGGGAALRHNEMLRTTLSLLLTAPEGTDVSYTFAGEETVDGMACNTINVEANGTSFKLYLDKTTNLPKMISYLGAPMKVMKFEKPASTDGAAEKDVKVFVRKMESSEKVEHQVRFSDFRTVGGLLLPHKWTATVGGKSGETVDITSYEINPANIADKFKNQKVFVRQSKEQ